MGSEQPIELTWETSPDTEEEDLDEAKPNEQEHHQPGDPPLVYSDVCPSHFSVDKPAGYPHIVDMGHFDDKTDQSNLRAVDGVATLLWNWKPEEAKKFFDTKRAKYEFSIDQTPQGYLQDILISRFSYNYVMVLAYTGQLNSLTETNTAMNKARIPPPIPPLP
jgi:hypothetical protein